MSPYELTSDIFCFIFYIMISLSIVFPPNEFVDSGLTIEKIFGHFLGDENYHFIEYQLRRTLLTKLVHCLLPLGLFLINHGYFWNEFIKMISYDESFNKFWVFSLLTAFMIAITSSVFCWTCTLKDFERHSVVRTLSLYGQWRTIASQINSEFRSIDKFCIETSATVKVIVTNNWIINIRPYTLNIINLADAILTLKSTETYAFAGNFPDGIQYLTIEIKCERNLISTFIIRVKSTDLSDLQEKLRNPILNMGNIRIGLTLTERFVFAFDEVVKLNEKYIYNQDTNDSCIGCLQNAANIKLRKMCGTSTCRNCECRPMWCITCMGKWFASRQDQTAPETWMSSICPCPTCRSTFCMVDVGLVQQNSN